MPRLFLFHLLGVCLLLNQFSRVVAAKWMDDVIKACGRELARAQIAICGKSTLGKRSLNQEDAPLKPRPVEEIVPSLINQDTETINMMSEFVANLPQELKLTLSERQPALPELQQHVPVLKDSNLSFEEFKKIILNRQSEATDSSPSELKSLGLDTHSRKKRQLYVTLSNKCCHIGCTKKSLAKFC
ncbi:PREDICTED: prorelaxin H2 [Colobus angolensis palliatus]|uniref:Insulin-like domain-containing protein n=1 Tax=Colobus angolensis palliatus TaxID=336983 RepID=A0A2K5JUG0_COLAP|nr:PREDICTED: prorelaxin H2 [Colobus angolensis palliatus]